MNFRTFTIFGSKIGDNYAWELDLFYKLRDFKDGVTFFELECNWDRYMSDHNPRFVFSLMILNFKIWDFSIYNIWHVDNENSPFYQQHLKEEEENMNCDGPDYERDNYD